jgi:hypothetical protein
MATLTSIVKSGRDRIVLREIEVFEKYFRI